jgi:hypothetical protein
MRALTRVRRSIFASLTNPLRNPRKNPTRRHLRRKLAARMRLKDRFDRMSVEPSKPDEHHREALLPDD